MTDRANVLIQDNLEETTLWRDIMRYGYGAADQATLDEIDKKVFLGRTSKTYVDSSFNCRNLIAQLEELNRFDFDSFRPFFGAAALCEPLPRTDDGSNLSINAKLPASENLLAVARCSTLSVRNNN